MATILPESMRIGAARKARFYLMGGGYFRAQIRWTAAGRGSSTTRSS
jgi:hypothetical protein